MKAGSSLWSGMQAVERKDGRMNYSTLSEGLFNVQDAGSECQRCQADSESVHAQAEDV
jgi:hypothetical protein